MKFACETCATKYVIPDERVAGKLLRVRCKRCRSVMEVVGAATERNRASTKAEKLAAFRGEDVAQDRPLFSARRQQDPFDAVGSGVWGARSGGRGEASDGGLRVSGSHQADLMPVPPAATAEWHVAIKGQARGPFTDEEMQLLAARARIHARSRVWRAGMDSWCRLEDVCELAFLNPHLKARASASREMAAPPLTPAPVPVLEEVTGMAEAPGWNHAPGKPFANLMASQALSMVPPPVPSDQSSPGLQAVGTTGWFTLSPHDVEQLLLEERAHEPGTSPHFTGTHLLRRRTPRVAYAVGGVVLLLGAVVGLLMLPMLLDSSTETNVGIQDVTARSRVNTTQEITADAQGQQLANIQALGVAAPVAVVAVPAVEAPKPDRRNTVKLDRVKNALENAAQTLR
jgi:predicted Zn finger-like uncharacterized protein